MYIVHTLQDSGISEKDQFSIESVVQEVCKKTQDLLALDECKIIVNAGSHKVQAGEIFQSFLCDETAFYIFVDTDVLNCAKQEDIVKNLTEHLYNGLYATARIRHMRLDTDCGIQEEIVGEGLSAHFVCEALKRDPKPYYTQLCEKDVETFLQAMQSDAVTGTSYEKWFRGSKEENIPSHTAHAVGFSLVDTYLKKTKQTSMDALKVPATYIFSPINY